MALTIVKEKTIIILLPLVYNFKMVKLSIMPCNHRFMNIHANGLFPNWEINKLFIGTFNPIWNKPNGNNADYFYGRSKYFWKIIPRYFNEQSLKNSTVAEKIAFCKKNKIGFTDLICNIEDADFMNQQHKNWIFSYKDTDLLNFHNLQYNTNSILDYLNENNQISAYFTRLGNGVGNISAQIQHIEANYHNTFRLHTPTGQGLGKGTPRANKLTCKWHQQGLAGINPNDFPWE